jgi:hypothetical protein
MSDATDLRDELAELAGPVHPADGFSDRVFARAGRIRNRRRIAGGAAATVCVLLLVSMVRLLGVGATPELVATPPDGPFLGWAALGAHDSGPPGRTAVTDVGDPGLVREATGVWDAGPDGPHTGVRVLAALRSRHLHSVVILQGYDQRGAPRLAFFTSDATAANRLRLRSDRPSPDPATTQVISLVSPRLTGPAGVAADDYWGTYAIALAMPGVTTVHIGSTTIDDQMRGEPDAPTGRLVVQSLPYSTTVPNTVITGFVKPRSMLGRPLKVFENLPDGEADGDARAVRADVVRRTGQQVVVDIRDSGRIAEGQFAVVTAGLVGRVAAVDPGRGEATVDLITSPAFTARGFTDISVVPGSIRGTGTAVVMEGIPAGEKNEIFEGNRVIVPDPVQHSDGIGAVTIGRAAQTRPAGADSVELTPTADLTGLREVYLMTPPEDAG